MDTNRLVRAWYVVVLATALIGSVTAAATWLDVPWWVATPPIAAVELGGVVLMRHAAERRAMGESALAPMSLSLAFASGAVAVNVFGHSHIGLSAFFGGMSAGGFAVFLIISAAKRRDALRKDGKLEDTPPVYGLIQWVTQPGVTRRARILAQANAATRLAEGTNPTTSRLGKLASLDAAREQVRAERRESAIATALNGLIRSAAGPVMADIAVHTYDPAQIAKLIAAGADYAGYARLLAADLTPARLAGVNTPERADDDLTALVDATAPTLDERIEAAVSRHVADIPTVTPPPARAPHRPRWRHHDGHRPRRLATSRTPQVTVVVSQPEPDARDTSGDTKPTRKTAAKTRTTAERVAAAVAKHPDIKADILATRLKVSRRTVERHMAATAVAVNGHGHSKES